MPSSFRGVRRRKQDRLKRLEKRTPQNGHLETPVQRIRDVGLLENPKGLNVRVPGWNGLVPEESDLDLRMLVACYETDANKELADALIDKLTKEHLSSYVFEAIELGMKGWTEVALMSLGRERKG